MPEQRSRPRDNRVIALANQKGGTGKTTTTVNLGIGLARLGKKVLLIDADPQGDLTTCLGWQDQDSLQTTLATVMGKIIRDEPFTADEGILHHSEGVDLMPANIELSDLEATLVNAMSREITLRTYVNEAKKNYDVVLIDCMPSLGITILSFIMIMTVYRRFFKLYLYTAIAPVPLSTFAGEPTQNVGKSFIKSYAAVCLEGAIIVLACIIFSLFAAAPPAIDPNAAAVTQVWSYIGELVFNMLVLVGAVKMADRVVREMMGL